MNLPRRTSVRSMVSPAARKASRAMCVERSFETNPVDRPMQTSSNTPRVPDPEVAVRIALVREMTEAARSGDIGWSIRDRRLRLLFGVPEESRAFDSTRPCYGK